MNVVARTPRQEEPRKSPVPKRKREHDEFLPAALEILETPASPVRIAILWFICILASTALLWAWLGTFDIVATAQGKLQPTGRVKIIQSLEMGRTISAAVENGTQVGAGDILIELDAAQILAEISAIKGNLAARQAEAARRTAGLRVAREITFDFTGKTPVTFPPDAINFPGDIPDEIQQRERNQFKAELDQLASGLLSLEAQRRQIRAEILRLESTIEARETLLLTQSERVEMRSKLADTQSGSRASLIDAIEVRQKEKTELVGQQGQLVEATSKGALISREADRQIKTFIAENAAKLSEAQRQIDELEQNLVKAQKRREQLIIKSPIAGTVQTSSLTTTGQVVTAGAELMRIVPASASLEIEAYVPNKDIGFLEVGQEAVIKIEAFPFTRYGIIKGKIIRVANDAIPEQDAQLIEQAAAKDTESVIPTGNAQRIQNLVFPVTVRPDTTTINVDGRTIPLYAGMAVTIEIKTGKRRILEYLFSPLTEISSEAMNER